MNSLTYDSAHQHLGEVRFDVLKPSGWSDIVPPEILAFFRSKVSSRRWYLRRDGLIASKTDGSVDTLSILVALDLRDNETVRNIRRLPSFLQAGGSTLMRLGKIVFFVEVFVDSTNPDNDAERLECLTSHDVVYFENFNWYLEYPRLSFLYPDGIPLDASVHRALP